MEENTKVNTETRRLDAIQMALESLQKRVERVEGVMENLVEDFSELQVKCPELFEENTGGQGKWIRI